MKRPGKAILILTILTVTNCAMAAGDPARGKALYERLCAACHSIDYNGVGPAHRGVFGRQAGSRPEYTYSPALATASIVWDDKTLERWLANPEKFVPGQKMDFSVPSTRDRKDIISYLKVQPANQ